MAVKAADGALLCVKRSGGLYLHQMGGHHTPGPHHVQQRAVLVPDDPQHGLTQTEEVERAAAIQGRPGLSCGNPGGTNVGGGSGLMSHARWISELNVWHQPGITREYSPLSVTESNS